ncbi:MAG: hypothetical protein IPP19_10085 [Verrucomicrobia bacterium]|nr:hypothetical protein [Verrucomicrobiota bacterium]
MYRNTKVLKAAVFTFLGSKYGEQLTGSDMIMRDNIICCNRRLTYNPEALGSRFVHDHNVYYFTNGGYMGSTVLDPTEKIADPQFIDPSKTNFRQQPGGPATTGADEILYNYDLDGVAIIQNQPVSIGAYQYR